MQANLRRIAAVMLIGFSIVALDLGYWQIVEAPGLTGNAALNAYRIASQERNTWRGRILDRNGVELARSEKTEDGYVRRYSPPLMPHVVGYHDLVYGDAGIEQSEADYLSGRLGGGLTEVLASRLANAPRIGADVRLTVDTRIQLVAEKALGGDRGAVVVLDPRTGAVLALASQPSFDPTTFQTTWDTLRASPSAPLLNRATQGAYTPGSVFKSITLAAALDLGYYTPDTKFACNDQAGAEGLPVSCADGLSGTFDLRKAYEQSCTSCFGNVGLRLGADELLEYARRFGFDSRPPLEIPARASQLIEPGEEARLVGALLQSTANGHGEITVSPLEMALTFSVFARDGTVPAPYLVEEIVDRKSNVLFRAQPRTWRTAVGQPTAAAVREMMAAASGDVAPVGGPETASVTASIGTVASGTAVPPNAWFVGFAPADNPRVVVAVVREASAGGGQAVESSARDVLTVALQNVK